MIEVRQVTKTYGKKKNSFTALDNVSFEIPDGASVAILGKSGSGKSTLMHTMSGLDRPEQGEVVIDGENILTFKQKAVDKFRSDEMSFIFQSFFVQGNESCYNNVSLPLEIGRTSMRQRKRKILAALKAVGLEDKVKSRARDLSGGQKQRLAIARAIVSNPKILFADEPTGNLDSATGKKIFNLLHGLSRTKNTTIVVVTHDLDIAGKTDRTFTLSDGKITTN